MYKIILAYDFADEFIEWWNHHIDNYGSISLYDVDKKLLGFNSFATYKDTMVGWDEKLTVDNLIMCKVGNELAYELKIPERGDSA